MEVSIYFNSFNAGIDYRRQNLTSKVGHRCERVKERCMKVRLSPSTELCNWKFHPLEVVPRSRDPQLQVSENYSDLTKWRSTNFKSC